jgi:membrane protein DedA with SNARE-associated domain
MVSRYSSRYLLTHFFTQAGLPLLFIAVMIESFGVPVPGETTLITFGALASQGHYDIRWVIACAAAGAIVGDNLGYWVIGRFAGHTLLERSRWFQNHAQRVLPRAEALMTRYGPRAVFLGRFVSILRITIAWVAGLTKMDWWKFLFWNAAGGIAWASAVALVAYYVGQTTGAAIQRYGTYAGFGVAGAAVLALIAVRLAHRRLAN